MRATRCRSPDAWGTSMTGDLRRIMIVTIGLLCGSLSAIALYAPPTVESVR